MSLIATTAELRAACARLSRRDFVTVDTEFHRETTFWPILCVIQLANEDEALAIDALAPDIDLTPLFELMADPAVIKVFHAARQDVEIFWKLSGSVPSPMFDTQVAAMVCGFGEQVSYSELAQSICRRRTIDKSSRFTDWARRPLVRRADRICDRRRHASARHLSRADGEAEGVGTAGLARGRDARADLACDLRAASRARLGAVQEPRAQAARSRRADGSLPPGARARRRRATCRARAC